MEDKRKSIRIPVELEGRLQMGEKSVPVTLLNLSIDGAFVKSPELVDASDEVLLMFALNGARIEAPGRVAWGGSIEGGERAICFGMGVHFQLKTEQKEILARYMRELMKS